jgi:hypothetical protein
MGTRTLSPLSVNISDREPAFDWKKGKEHFFSLTTLPERDFNHVPVAF